jgi:hypothetical protein
MNAAEQFFGMFASANQAIWPLQIVWYGAAVAAIILALRPIRASSRLIAAFLATYYFWVGIVFFWVFYSPLYSLAGFDGAIFVLQGALWFVAGVARSDLVFRPRWNALSVVGGMFIVYSLAAYPILGMLSGHVFPAAPIFGIAPCPTAIFTFGLLLWTRGRAPKYLVFVPLAWSLAAWPGALSVGVLEDLAMPVAALLGAALLFWRDRTSPRWTFLAGIVVVAMVLGSGHDDILLGASAVFVVAILAQELAHWRGAAYTVQRKEREAEATWKARVIKEAQPLPR